MKIMNKNNNVDIAARELHFFIHKRNRGKGLLI